MLGRGRRRAQSLLVVDLESRGGARRVLEWRARRIAARLAARSPGADPVPRVLLHLPEGTGPSRGWLAGVHVTRTGDHVAGSRLRDIHERVFATSRDVVRRAPEAVFPHVAGVGLGQLNLGLIQDCLTSFSVMSAALGDMLDAGEVGDCHILSADVGFARALARQVAGRAEVVSAWPPPRLAQAARWARSRWSALRPMDQRKAEQAARDAMTVLLREQGLTRTRPQVLVVSESRPMAHMFGVVEGALARAGVGSVVRMDFNNSSGRAGAARGVAFRCGAAGSLGLKGGLFRARWRDAQRALQDHTPAVFDDSPEALLLEGVVGYLYLSAFDAQAKHVWAADTALELLQPDVVLVGNDRTWGGQAFVQLARSRGIPSVCVQDGVAGDLPFWWWSTADHLAATSEQLVEMLVRHGVPPERCTVTGQPRYDFVTWSSPEDQRATRLALGLEPSTFCVLFAVQPIHGVDYVRSVASALLAVSGVHVMLRPHPADRRNMCERVMREYRSPHMTLHRTGDSLTLVRACDALVTQHSTVALEAALLGRPVISATFGGLHGLAQVVTTGIATPVRGPEELTRAIERLVGTAREPPVTPRPSQHTNDALLGPADGHAGDRVAALVAETLQRRPEAAVSHLGNTRSDGGLE